MLLKPFQKFFVVIAVALACVAADVSHLEKDYAPIVKSTYEINPQGGYQYEYETGNGIFARSSGEVKNPNAEYPSQFVQGAFKYTAPDGVTYEVTYTADEEGFHPEGQHLPVPPPTPEAILRSLAYIEANPPAVEGSFSPVKPKSNPKPNYG